MSSAPNNGKRPRKARGVLSPTGAKCYKQEARHDVLGMVRDASRRHVRAAEGFNASMRAGADFTHPMAPDGKHFAGTVIPPNARLLWLCLWNHTPNGAAELAIAYPTATQIIEWCGFEASTLRTMTQFLCDAGELYVAEPPRDGRGLGAVTITNPSGEREHWKRGERVYVLVRRSTPIARAEWLRDVMWEQRLNVRGGPQITNGSGELATREGTVDLRAVTRAADDVEKRAEQAAVDALLRGESEAQARDAARVVWLAAFESNEGGDSEYVRSLLRRRAGPMADEHRNASLDRAVMAAKDRSRTAVECRQLRQDLQARRAPTGAGSGGDLADLAAGLTRRLEGAAARGPTPAPPTPGGRPRS